MIRKCFLPLLLLAFPAISAHAAPSFSLRNPFRNRQIFPEESAFQACEERTPSTNLQHQQPRRGSLPSFKESTLPTVSSSNTTSPAPNPFPEQDTWCAALRNAETAQRTADSLLVRTKFEWMQVAYYQNIWVRDSLKTINTLPSNPFPQITSSNWQQWLPSELEELRDMQTEVNRLLTKEGILQDNEEITSLLRSTTIAIDQSEVLIKSAEISKIGLDVSKAMESLKIAFDTCSNIRKVVHQQYSIFSLITSAKENFCYARAYSQQASKQSNNNQTFETTCAVQLAANSESEWNNIAEISRNHLEIAQATKERVSFNPFTKKMIPASL